MLKKLLGLILLVVLAWLIRVQYLAKGGLSFSYDQARDAFVMGQMLHGDLKIQGPPTSTGDFFHGVLYYYLVAPGYFLGHGDPRVAAAWMAGIASLGVVVVYYFSLRMFNNKLASVLSAVIFAFSFEQTQFATYLSNTFFAVVAVPTLYWGLWEWMHNNKWGSVMAGLALGLCVQSNLFLLYHIPIIAILFLIKYIKFDYKSIITFFSLFFLTISSMILSEIKFGFPSRRGPLDLLQRQDYAHLKIGLVAYVNIIIKMYTQLFSANLFPAVSLIGLLLGMLVVLLTLTKIKKDKWPVLIVLGLGSFIPALIFGGISTPYIDAGLSGLLVVLAGYWLAKLWPSQKIVFAIFFVSIIVGNIYAISKINPGGQVLFAIQSDMNLHNSLSAIDFTYQTAQGRPFSINSITAPLYINTTWSYLYNWYGMQKYGYLPTWHGHAQTNLLGNNLVKPSKETTDYFLLIEPTINIPKGWVESILAEEDGYSRYKSSVNYGEIIVQYRQGLAKK